MSNLGAYQTMTRLAKKVGGPIVLGAFTFVGGYAVLRPVEAGTKRVIRRVKNPTPPCESKGKTFQVTVDGDEKDVSLRVGGSYRVLECDGDAILIEVVGDPDNPYFVSSKFLRSVSNFPVGGSTTPE